MIHTFASSVLDEYLKEHNFEDYSSIVLSKDATILYEKYRDGYNGTQKQNISFLVPGIIGLLTGEAINRHYIKSIEVSIRYILPEFDLGIDHFHRILKIKHLLSMSSGILWSPSWLWLRHIYYDLLTLHNPALALSRVLVADVPGMFFCYKEWDFILLANILEKVLPCSLNEFCHEVLFDPLGITLTDEEFYLSSDTLCHTLFGHKESFHGSVYDIQKLAQMLLSKGMYENRRVITSGYIREMLTPQKTNMNYGYLWSLYPFGYGTIAKDSNSLILNPDKGLCYILFMKSSSHKNDYSAIYAKLIEYYHLYSN